MRRPMTKIISKVVTRAEHRDFVVGSICKVLLNRLIGTVGIPD